MDWSSFITGLIGGGALVRLVEMGIAWARERREAALHFRPHLSVIGTLPEPQSIQIEADRRITVLQIDYMSSAGAIVVRKTGSWSGTSFCVPIDDLAVAEVLRLGIGRNPNDGSAPIQFALHFTVGAMSKVVVLPAFVKPTYVNSTNYRQVIG